jgi:hypothetical protein
MKRESKRERAEEVREILQQGGCTFQGEKGHKNQGDFPALNAVRTVWIRVTVQQYSAGPYSRKLGTEIEADSARFFRHLLQSNPYSSI